MYNGFTESPERIEERKRRILTDYKPENKLRAFVSRHKAALEATAILVGSVLLTDIVALALVSLVR